MDGAFTISNTEKYLRRCTFSLHIYVRVLNFKLLMLKRHHSYIASQYAHNFVFSDCLITRIASSLIVIFHA